MTKRINDILAVLLLVVAATVIASAAVAAAAVEPAARKKKIRIKIKLKGRRFFIPLNTFNSKLKHLESKIKFNKNFYFK